MRKYPSFEAERTPQNSPIWGVRSAGGRSFQSLFQSAPIKPTQIAAVVRGLGTILIKNI